MKDQYIAPELKLVGATSEVVLGLFSVGNDMFNEFQASSMEFAED